MLNNKLNNNKRVLRVKNNSSRNLNSNNMRRETIIPLIIGLLVGALFVVFFQFNSRLNSNALRLSQLEQATAANTKNVTDVIAFINNATGAQNQAGGTQAPATTPAN
jgi:uncharacterized membrane protein YvbJ